MPKKENVDNTTVSDSSCILMLTEAEKRAKEVIEAAKKRKGVLVKKAKDDSAIEIEKFKREHEEALSKLQKQTTSGQDNDAILFEKEHEKRIMDLKIAFRSTSQATLSIILNNIINVQPKFHENLIVK